MDINIRNLFLAWGLSLSLPVGAQDLSTKQPLIDCGQVVFRTPVTVEFEVKNESSKELKISAVRTSCGCTTANYPQQTIPSGTSARIEVIYDAKQMGRFEKQVAVYDSHTGRPLLLTLRGTVVAEALDFQGNYPYTLGSLRSDRNRIEFDDVIRGEVPSVKIHVMNPTPHASSPVIMHIPNYLEYRVSPSTIAPGHSGEVIITLRSDKLRDFGLHRTEVYMGMNPGDKVSSDKEISISALLLPGYSELNDYPLGQAPALTVSSDTLDLGAFGNKSKLKGELIIQNTGRSVLNIRSLQMFNTGVRASIGKLTLQPMETTRIRITATRGEWQDIKELPKLLMITNDPMSPKTIITVKACP